MKAQWEPGTFLILLTTLSLAAKAQVPADQNKSNAPSKLSVQVVVDQVISQGLDKKSIDNNAERAKLSLALAEGTFDPTLTASYGFDDSKADTLATIGSNQDKTSTYNLGFSKKFATGSSLSVDYTHSSTSSILNSFASSSRLPYYATDVASVQFKQELLNNSFGGGDRLRVQAAQLQVDQAFIERNENIEDLVLRAVKLYWDTFAAKESLQETLAAREKYRILVRTLERKSQMGFDDRAELAKAKAELQTQERNVKSASLLYLNLINNLYTLMNLPQPEDVDFDVPSSIPQPPKLVEEAELVQLRKIRSLQKAEQKAESELSLSKEALLPSLSFVARAYSYGLDREDSTAFAEFSRIDHPRYFVGLELSYKFGSALSAGDIAVKTVNLYDVQNQKQKALLNELQSLNQTSRNLDAKYIVVKNAQDSVRLWERAIKDQETNHRVGRISTAELIMDYNSYFRARAAFSTTLADYHYALQEYLAARDQLVRIE